MDARSITFGEAEGRAGDITVDSHSQKGCASDIDGLIREREIILDELGEELRRRQGQRKYDADCS